jgi:hypothetical protein
MGKEATWWQERRCGHDCDAPPAPLTDPLPFLRTVEYQPPLQDGFMHPGADFFSDYVVVPLRFMAPSLSLMAFGLVAFACGQASSKRSFAGLVLFLIIPTYYFLMDYLYDGYRFESLHGNVFSVYTGVFRHYDESLQQINMTACLFWMTVVLASFVIARCWQRRKGNDGVRNAG